ncbi:hypothetical protein GCM10023168_24460 [Fodinibacter luteus]|uniref:LPXTG-motif cell wall-anchored protein n=1 Tax=Fodinibacter luteus TaxID=552064 RepID=A0ABP8KK62_9MICO
MSTPTTARGALLRRAGTLLAAVALVAVPAATAVAAPTDPTSSTATPTTSASPSPSADASSPTTTPSAGTTSTTTTDPAPSTTTPTEPTVPQGQPTPDAVARLSSSALLAAAGTRAPQTAAAADFVARTLAAGGDHYVYPGGTWFDGGNTIDGIIALAASGSGATQLGESLAYLGDNLASYTGSAGEAYAGPTAKALLGVVVAGGDPTAFAGRDLVAALTVLETADGRFSDDSTYGDYSNTIGQSLAVLALVRAGVTPSSASVDLLLAQQCADGGFRGDIGASGCTSDPDATAFAAQALVAVGEDAAAGDALDWLAAAQAGDGSLESADGAANANTTGVAAQAFAAGGRDAQLADAQAFLVSLQYGCTAPAALRGGLAFSTATRSTTAVADSDLRATPQGTLGFAGQSLLSVQASEEAASGTTPMDCATSTSEPTRTDGATSTSEPTSTGSATSGAGMEADGEDDTGSGASEADAGAASSTGSLAQTGSDLLLPVGLGLVLVLVGAVAIAATRRRGVHT